MEHSFNIQSWVGNGISLGAIAISIFGYIPAIAAGVALVWYLLQIYESATVQIWLRRRRRRLVLRLQARIASLEALEHSSHIASEDQSDA